MISRGVIVWLAIAIITGVGLFLVKYQVRQLEEKLLTLNQRVLRNQDATHILRAEWAHLNDIARIEALNARFLKLQPMTTAQIGSIDALPIRRQPAPQPPAPPAKFDSIDQLLQSGGGQ